MTPRITATQRTAIADIVKAELTRDPSKRPHDEHLRTELSDIALALESLASEMADDGSPLTDRVERTASQVRALLAHRRSERGEAPWVGPRTDIIW